MITFKKIKYGDLPDNLTNAIVSFGEHEVKIDDTGLTRVELQRLFDYLKERGYVEQ